MKFRLYTLIACSLIWFFFGTFMINRGMTDLEELTEFKGKLTAIGTTKTSDLRRRKSDVMCFNLQGLNQTLGIYHNKKSDYDFYLQQLEVGDFIKVYFNAKGVKAKNINLHVFQLEHDGVILLNHRKLTKTLKKVGLILYLIGLIFSIAPIWFYRTKIRKKKTVKTSYE